MTSHNTPSPSDKPRSSVTKRITRGFEVMKKVLTSDIGEMRETITDLLKKKDPAPPEVTPVAEKEEPVLIKSTEGSPGMVNVRASRRIETGRTPRQLKDLVPLPDDAKKEDRSLSDAFTEEFRRMSELVFMPDTNPIYAFMSEMFLHIRVRPSDLQANKTWDQIFEEQIRWYCEEHYLSKRKVLSPALAFHWDCYFQSPESERYEDNLADHPTPEIKLYGILMRSCFRSFDRYLQQLFPGSDVSPRPSPSTKVLITDDDRTEGGALREGMKGLRAQRYPRLLLNHALSDYFEENLPRNIKKRLDASLPAGIDGVYLFDTNLFVSAALEKDAGRSPTLGAVLNDHAMDGICQEVTGIKGFFRFPVVENRPDRFSTADIACKNLLFWKRMGDEAFYKSLAQKGASDESPNSDYDVDFIGTSDLRYLALRVVEVIQRSSNIYEVISALFPDLDPSIFSDGTASFAATRFEKLALVTRMLLQEEKELGEISVGFFGILSRSNFALWNKTSPQLNNRTPFQFMKQRAKAVSDSMNEREIDSAKERMVYESQWNFLNQAPEKAWDAKSSSYYSRMRRLSGWRMVQRNVRLKMIDGLLQEMGWNFREHVLDEQKDDWWMTLDERQTAEETKRQLTLPFITYHGKVLVCRFPELQR